MAAYSTLVSVLLIVSMSATCFAPSAPRPLSRRLRTKPESECQRLLTVGIWANSAYLSVWRALFDLSASPSAFAPAWPTLFHSRLRKGSKSECQRLLTVGNSSMCGVLEVFERRISLEGFGEVLCAVWTKVVGAEAANRHTIAVSAAADTRAESEHI